MRDELNLQRLILLDENQLNPSCHNCKKELSAFLISQEELIEFFTPEEVGWLLQEKLIKQSQRYMPKLIIFLCRHCIKKEK